MLDPEVEAFTGHLKRLMPYLPSEVRARQKGAYPAIDAAGDVGERLGRLVYEPGEMGDGVWERSCLAIAPVAQEVLIPRVRRFSIRAAEAALDALKVPGPPGARAVEITEVQDLFGPEVGFDVANETWQRGYVCALARAFLEAGGDPERFQPRLAPIEQVSTWYHEMTAPPVGSGVLDGSWVLRGLEEPYSAALMEDIIGFVIDGLFRRLRPVFGEELEHSARAELHMLALTGLGVGRLQLDDGFTTELRSPPTHTPLPSTAARGASVPLIPADVRAMFESAGAAMVPDPTTDSVAIALNGVSLARVYSSPPAVVWDDPTFSEFLVSLFAYDQMARTLQENHGPSTLSLRQELRAHLPVDRLLKMAAAARLRVRQKGGLTTKEYYLWHPAVDEFARLVVLRGQSHVVEVAFSSPTVVIPLRTLMRLQESLSGQ